VAGAQKGRRRPSVGSRDVDAAAGGEPAEDAANAGQAVAEGRATARGRDAGSWLRGRVRLLWAILENSRDSRRVNHAENMIRGVLLACGVHRELQDDV
jgi:hypothetical protein